VFVFLDKGRKDVHKMTMKLMHVVNFINILWAAFAGADPESAKRLAT
jgi:hypothetical protein